MGVELAAQSYKRPGIKTNLNSTRTLPKFQETQTSSSTSTASTSSSSTSKSDKSIKYTALSALGTTSRQSIQSGAVRQGGTRFVNPSDYTLRNVDAQLTQSIATGFAPTPRSARREADRLNADLQKYVQYVNSQRAYANTGTNKAAGTMSAISMLNQTIGSVTKAVASTKASKPSVVSNSSTPAANLSADAANVLTNLSSATNTKALKSELSSLGSKIDTKSKLVEQYQGQIDADSESKTNAEKELATIKENISTTKTSITGISNRTAGKLVITWKKAKSADGYEIYRRAGTTNPYVRAAVIKSGSTTKYTNAKLKKGHTYYYRIRSYRYDENGRKIYSGWSTVKKQKVK